MSNQKHHCQAEEKLIMGQHGPAITECIESEDGKLWVTNGEYEQVVKHCPFCGYKSNYLAREKAKKMKAEGYSLRESGSSRSGDNLKCGCCEENTNSTLFGIENKQIGQSADKFVCITCLMAMYPNA